MQSRLAEMNGDQGAGFVCSTNGLLYSFKKNGAGYKHCYTLKHIHTSTHVRTYTRNKHAHPHLHACTHTHVHSRTHTHTHTHINSQTVENTLGFADRVYHKHIIAN